MLKDSGTSSTATRGAMAAAASFLFWGIVPIYWKQMQELSAFELIAHRVLWSLLFLLGITAWQKSFADLKLVLADSRALTNSLCCSALLAVNWTVYIWAVNSGHIIEGSLGYFLTPLCNVALGYIFLHERLRRLQWTAIAFAAAGVLLLLVRAGYVPWIALTLAGTWSLYGMLKKRSPLGPLTGLTVETAVLLPLAAAFLLWRGYTGQGALGQVGLGLHLLILSVGIVTTLPLMLFAYGAQRLRLVTLGLLQYIAPTVQFLVGLYLYLEPFDALRLQAFGLIWCGLILYTADSFWRQRSKLWPAAEPLRTGNSS